MKINLKKMLKEEIEDSIYSIIVACEYRNKFDTSENYDKKLIDHYTRKICTSSIRLANELKEYRKHYGDDKEINTNSGDDDE